MANLAGRQVFRSYGEDVGAFGMAARLWTTCGRAPLWRSSGGALGGAVRASPGRCSRVARTPFDRRPAVLRRRPAPPERVSRDAPEPRPVEARTWRGRGPHATTVAQAGGEAVSGNSADESSVASHRVQLRSRHGRVGAASARRCEATFHFMLCPCRCQWIHPAQMWVGSRHRTCRVEHTARRPAHTRRGFELVFLVMPTSVGLTMRGCSLQVQD